MIKKHTTILSLLGKRCRSMRELKQLHCLMITTALVKDIIPLSRLVDFCTDTNSGHLDYAQSIFLHIDQPSVYIWNSMIRGLSNSQTPNQALFLYHDMHRFGYSPDNFTFPFALKACAKIPGGRGFFGSCIHTCVVKSGYESDVYVSSTLIQMYVSSGDMDSAKLLFEMAPNRNVVGWTTMIAGYVKDDQASEALKLFKEMELARVAPNEITMVHVLVACAQTRDLETGRWVHHDQLHRRGTDSIRSNVVLATALLDMYARCGSLKVARCLFDEMPQRNEVSWNTMISGYNQYGRWNEVLQLFAGMRNTDLKPDKVTLLGLLGACANMGGLGLGQGIHAYIEKTISGKDVAIGTSLMDMYAKIGDTRSALQIFGGLERKDVLAWTSMIIGLAMHGHGEEALNLFGDMEGDGVAPDGITFLGVLSACSHLGLIDEGRKQFNSMRRVHGITPTVEHYGCMVDLLSRAGKLVEAERLANSMPIQPNIMIWGAILSGCEIHGDVDLADRIGNKLTEFSPRGSGVYVLLSNIYAGAGRWQGVERARQLMRHNGIEKTLGSSSIEVKMPVHKFTTK